jgi:hypothetical protein
MYGYGPNAAPFQGGFLCILPPIKRTSVQNSGGSSTGSDCTGSYSYDFNAEIQGGSDAALVAGEDVYLQYWYRDPLSPSATGLTDALRIFIQV